MKASLEKEELINAHKEQIQNLEETTSLLSRSNQEVYLLQTELQKRSNEIDGIESNLRKKNEELIKNHQKETKKLNKIIDHFKAEDSRAHNQLAHYEDELKYVRDDLEKITQELTVAKNTKAKQCRYLLQKDEEIAMLKNDIQTIEAEKQVLINTNYNEVKTLNDIISKMKHDEDYYQQYLEKQEDLTQMQEEIQCLENSYTQKIQQQQYEIECKEKEIKGLQEHIQGLESSYSQTIQHQQQEMQHKQEEIQGLQEHIQGLENSYSQKIDQHHQEIQNAEREIQALKSNSGSRCVELEEQVIENKSLRKQMKELTKLNKKYINDIASYNQIITGQHNTIMEMQNLVEEKIDSPRLNTVGNQETKISDLQMKNNAMASKMEKMEMGWKAIKQKMIDNENNYKCQICKLTTDVSLQYSKIPSDVGLFIKL